MPADITLLPDKDPGGYSPDDPLIEGVARTLSQRMFPVNHKKVYNQI